MGEKQEKVFVVSRYSMPTPKNDYQVGDNVPVKVFDDRKDARAYRNRMNERSSRYGYIVHGVLKG